MDTKKQTATLEIFFIRTRLDLTATPVARRKVNGFLKVKMPDFIYITEGISRLICNLYFNVVEENSLPRSIIAILKEK